MCSAFITIEKEIEDLNQKVSESKALESSAESAAAPQPKTEGKPSEINNLDMILDLDVDVVVKLGETVQSLSDIAKLVMGDIISLDKASNAPVDVIVNNKIIAKGELIVIPPYNFAIKITEVKDRIDRIKNISFH